jgi:FtsP/CotA-like multicopper oxidase with cupredoxin domain
MGVPTIRRRHDQLFDRTWEHSVGSELNVSTRHDDTRMTSSQAIICACLTAVSLACGKASLTGRAAPNDNRTPAGTLRDGVLTLHLDARGARWYPDGDDGPSLVMQMFAETGHETQNPGPLIRVPAGTMVRVSVHNALRGSTLVVYGLATRPSAVDDTMQIAPGATRERSFVAGAPGTYFYWGSTTHQPVDSRNGVDSQLHGAFVVDPGGAPPPPDRIFVLGSWTGPTDRRIGFSPDLRTINGVSWPHTERLTYTAGDTVRWRWVNPTDSPHPMHLHGFYFGVTHRGTWSADTAFATPDIPRVVTELTPSGGTYEMTWVPEEPGNWLMHCHVAYHTSMFLRAVVVPDLADPIAVNPMAAMRGMVLAINVRPGSSPARRATTTAGARAIRLVAKRAPNRFKGRLDEMAFVRQDGDVAPPGDSVPSPSSLLVLHRDEPVRITIVNHLRAPTGVHWHGIEVPAFSDGVPGWSGSGSRVAPVITPGDSFVASFTPPRSGTFIYHAHANESYQIPLGLYGALLVVDSATYDPAHERLILLGSDGPESHMARINGHVVPDTMRLTAGETYRLRLIHMVVDWNLRLSLARGDSVVEWRALAKDGAELPARLQTMRPATLLAGPGETMDFEYRPTAPGVLQLDVAQWKGAWKTRLPIRVEPAHAH